MHFAPVTDTWLHFATKRVNFSQVTPTSDAFGLRFGVYDSCTCVHRYVGFDTSLNYNLNDPTSGLVLLGSSPVEVLSNISDPWFPQTHAAESDQFAYLEYAELSLLASTRYIVKLYAVQSQCKPVISSCLSNANVIGVGTDEQYPLALQDTADRSVGSSNSATMGSFTDSSGSNSNR
jgi:hypothetical protein